MERDVGIYQDELSTKVTLDGFKLIVITKRMEKGEWSLSIQNEYGIATCWLEFFSTAQKAIEAGLMTIQNEGIDKFINTDDFEYLFEDHV